MAKIRVLVVDDSVVVRRFLSDVIAADAELQLVGTAPGARLALAKLEQMPVDVVTLDVEMPDMNGIEALTAIRRIRPNVPVLMCSSLTERGAVATLDALTHGANDYIAKPSGAQGAGSRAVFAEELVAKIKAMARGRMPLHAPAPAPAAPRATRVTPGVASATRIDVVAIGVSTGGPNALARILPELPQDFSLPVVVVQHMPPLFTRMLAERLANTSRVRCVEAAEGMPLSAGCVYIAPGDHHMIVTRGSDGVRLSLHKGAPENSCRPAVDVLFRSVADVFGAHTLGVVLTGMGQDGFKGCEALRGRGAKVIVQDQATSVVWGMPGYIAQAGLAEEILPLEHIAAAILRRTGGERRHRAVATT